MAFNPQIPLEAGVHSARRLSGYAGRAHIEAPQTFAGLLEILRRALSAHLPILSVGNRFNLNPYIFR